MRNRFLGAVALAPLLLLAPAAEAHRDGGLDAPRVENGGHKGGGTGS